MSITTHALPIPGHARSVAVSAHILPDGTRGLFWTGPRGRIGTGGYHGIELYARGRDGAVIPVAVLAPDQARAIAAALIAEAHRLEDA